MKQLKIIEGTSLFAYVEQRHDLTQRTKSMDENILMITSAQRIQDNLKKLDSEQNMAVYHTLDQAVRNLDERHLLCPEKCLHNKVELQMLKSILREQKDSLHVYHLSAETNALLTQLMLFIKDLDEANISPELLASVISQMDCLALDRNRLEDIQVVYSSLQDRLKDEGFMLPGSWNRAVLKAAKEKGITISLLGIDIPEDCPVYDQNRLCALADLAREVILMKQTDFPELAGQIQTLEEALTCLTADSLETEVMDQSWTNGKAVADMLDGRFIEFRSGQDVSCVELAACRDADEEIRQVLSQIKRLLEAGVLPGDILVTSFQNDLYARRLTEEADQILYLDTKNQDVRNLRFHYYSLGQLSGTILFRYVEAFLQSGTNAESSRLQAEMAQFDYFRNYSEQGWENYQKWLKKKKGTDYKYLSLSEYKQNNQKRKQELAAWIRQFGEFEMLSQLEDQSQDAIIKKTAKKIAEILNKYHEKYIPEQNEDGLLPRVQDYVQGIRDFLYDSDLTGLLNEELAEKQRKAPFQAENLQEGFNALVDLFDLLEKEYGKDRMSLDNFCELFHFLGTNAKVYYGSSGYDAIEIAPPSAAQSAVCDYLFVLGSNQDLLPKLRSTQIFGDDVMAQLSDLTGRELRLEKTWMDLQYESVSRIVSSAKKKVVFTWSQYDSSFRPMKQAAILNPLTDKYNIPVLVPQEEADRKPEDIKYTYDLLNSMLAKGGRIPTDPVELPAGMGKEWQRNIETIQAASVQRPAEAKAFAALLARQLKDQYDRQRRILQWQAVDFGTVDFGTEDLKQKPKLDSISVTRLEAYIRCPFSFYYDTFVRPKELKEMEVTAADKGNLYHSVFCKLFETCKLDENTVFDEKTEKKYMACLEQIVDDELAAHNHGLFQKTAALRQTRHELKRRILFYGKVLWFQLSVSKFRPWKLEADIGENGHYVLDGVEITGRADRVDCWKDKDNNKIYLRVIDYKSSPHEINSDKLQSTLQPFLYLKKFLQDEQSSNAEPGGMYYAHVHQEVNKVKISKSQHAKPASELQESEIKSKSYQMKGITSVGALEASDVLFKDGLDSSGREPVVDVKIAKGEVCHVWPLLQDHAVKKQIDEVEKIAKDAVKSIQSGRFSIEQRDADDAGICKYCPYGTLCHDRIPQWDD